MLEFIDPFADARPGENRRPVVVSVWIGRVQNRKSLKKYLSAGTPENGQFVRDLGVEWYDHDFIAGDYQKQSEPVEKVVDDLAQALGCPDEMKQEMLRRCQARGLVQANTSVCLMQHVFKGNEDQDFNGLVFAGSYEFEEPQQAPRYKFDHLFVGVTTAATLPDLREYVTAGQFTRESGLGGDDLQYYGYKLRDAMVVPPREFFSLPIVNQRIVTGDSAQQIDDACRTARLEGVNAFISAAASDAVPLDIEPGHTFCGLHYLGVFKTRYPE